MSPFVCFLISIDFDGESISRTDLYVKEIFTTVELLNADRSQSSFIGKSAVPAVFGRPCCYRVDVFV